MLKLRRFNPKPPLCSQKHVFQVLAMKLPRAGSEGLVPPFFWVFGKTEYQTR